MDDTDGNSVRWQPTDGTLLDRLPAESVKVLLLVTDAAVRSRLRSWLESRPAITVATAEDTLPDQFDCCILDERSLDEVRTGLVREKQAERPTYLPVALLQSPESDDRETLAPEIGELIDDLIILPIDRQTLRYRITNLLMVRQLSVDLADQRGEYRRLLSVMPEAVILVDGTEITYANDIAISLFGADEAIVGRSIFEFVPSSNLEAVTPVVEQPFDSQGAAFVETTLRTDDGSSIVAGITGVTVVSDGGSSNNY